MKCRLYTSTALAILSGMCLMPLSMRGQDKTSRNNGEKFVINVALDGSTNKQVDVDPTDPNDLIPGGFARGDFGVVDGSIYPAGTLQAGTQNNDPANPQGRLGRIRCRAAYLITITEAINGAPYASFVSELYTFDDDQHSTLIADGYGPTTGFSTYRTVVGGTGRFRNMIGELYEENIGINSTGFCNFKLTFKLRKVE